eukprot:6214638-Pleurochrysis_carterae.AAC.4
MASDASYPFTNAISCLMPMSRMHIDDCERAASIRCDFACRACMMLSRVEERNNARFEICLARTGISSPPLASDGTMVSSCTPSLLFAVIRCPGLVSGGTTMLTPFITRCLPQTALLTTQ